MQLKMTSKDIAVGVQFYVYTADYRLPIEKLTVEKILSTNEKYAVFLAHSEDRQFRTKYQAKNWVNVIERFETSVSTEAEFYGYMYSIDDKDLAFCCAEYLFKEVERTLEIAKENTFKNKQDKNY